MSSDGTPGCRCVRARVDINGVCVVCRRERLHVSPKSPPFASTRFDARETRDNA